MKWLWLQRFTSNILRHRWYAVSLAFASTLIGVCTAQVISNLPVLVGLIGLSGSIFLTLLAILVAALVTLVNGAVEGALVMLAATLPYLATIYLPLHSGPDASVMILWVWIALGVAVASNIFTWVFAVMLRRKTSCSALVQMAALFGVLVVSVAHLVYPDIANWWGMQLHALQTYYEQASSVAGAKLTIPEVSAETQTEMIDVLKQLVNGMIVMLVLINALFQLALARWWQSAVYSPGSLGRELRYIRLSRMAGMLFLLSLVFSYQGNSVVLDVMPIVYILFGAAGLSLVHYIFKRMDSPNAWFWLMVFYVILFFTVPFSVVMIAILGLFDIWLNVRGRITKV